MLKSKKTIEFTKNKSKSKATVLDILCIECGRSTTHHVVASLDEDGSECLDPDLRTPLLDAQSVTIKWENNYQIIQCQGCKSVSFRHQSWFSEFEDPWYGGDGITEHLYPKRNATTHTARPFQNIPTTLQRIYAETIDCFNNECPILCTAGMRALVEGICVNRGIKGGLVSKPKKGGGTQLKPENTLEGKIAGMVEKGFLTEANAETLHQLRWLGNDAIHQLARPSVKELKLAIEIIEHTLEQIYEIPEKGKALDLRGTSAKRKK